MKILSERPASGSEILDEWQKISPTVTRADWPRLSGALASHQVSSRLVSAGRLLLHEGRQDEAYWLCVEAIEENPNNAEAVNLMNSFPKYAHQRKMRQRIVSIAVVGTCACLLLLAFVIGRHSSSWDGRQLPEAVEKAREKAGRSAILATALHPAGPDAGRAPLRDDGGLARKLCGTLYVAAHPQDGNLHIDADVVERDMDLKRGIAVEPGNHVLSWIDGNGNVLWREKIAMLPFATKIVTVKQ